jgi:hypothetical protein
MLTHGGATSIPTILSARVQSLSNGDFKEFFAGKLPNHTLALSSTTSRTQGNFEKEEALGENKNKLWGGIREECGRQQ